MGALTVGPAASWDRSQQPVSLPMPFLGSGGWGLRKVEMPRCQPEQ